MRQTRRPGRGNIDPAYGLQFQDAGMGNMPAMRRENALLNYFLLRPLGHPPRRPLFLLENFLRSEVFPFASLPSSRAISAGGNSW
jgi:hypothetical protein